MHKHLLIAFLVLGKGIGVLASVIIFMVHTKYLG